MQLPLVKVTFDLLNLNQILLGLNVSSYRPMDQGYSVMDDHERSVDPIFYEVSLGLVFLIIKLQIVVIRH
jgi:hypothetical protein